MKKICTMYLPAESYESFKKQCRHRDTSANKEVAKFIEKVLEKWEVKSDHSTM